jgi:peptide-methionine (R)-S-oxide reductase
MILLDKSGKNGSRMGKALTEKQYILRKQGTERPSKMNLMTTKRVIIFCAACKLPLFDSETKFNSGTGWPSFMLL